MIPYECCSLLTCTDILLWVDCSPTMSHGSPWHRLKRLTLLTLSDIFHDSLLKLFYNYEFENLPHYIISQTQLTHTITIQDTAQFWIIQHQVYLEVRNAWGTTYRVLLKKPSGMFSERWMCIVIMGSVYIWLQIRMQPEKLLYVSTLRIVIHL